MSISHIIESINTARDSLPDTGSIKNEERLELLAACERLKAVLETPLQVVTRIVFGTHLASALRIGVDLGIFNIILGADETDLSQLTAHTGADPLLIIRIMRILTGMNVFKEVGKEKYIAQPLAGLFINGSPLQDAITHLGMNTNVIAKLPEYFQEKGYNSPDDAYSGPFQYALNTKLHYFDWLKKVPKQQAAFNSLMQISRMGKGEEWFDIFPVKEKLRCEKDNVLLIDVGGGLGHDLTAFRNRHPDLSGRLILQDLPTVIDDIKNIGEGIETMKYDFFTPQLVKGARAYYLRTVIHDWPDKQAHQILRNIRAAMTEDSILLLNENFLPESNVPLYSAEIDITMMALFSSLERTQKQWENLLETAGFKVVNVWAPRAPVVGSGLLFEAVACD